MSVDLILAINQASLQIYEYNSWLRKQNAINYLGVVITTS